MKHLQLRNISSYRKSFELSNFGWTVVTKWDAFARNTIGSQFVRALDSISANIAEGFGRYSKKERINFYRTARGSTFEALDWNQKAYVRKLLNKKEYDIILKELQNLPREINQLIRFTREKLKE